MDKDSALKRIKELINKYDYNSIQEKINKIYEEIYTSSNSTPEEIFSNLKDSYLTIDRGIKTTNILHITLDEYKKELTKEERKLKRHQEKMFYQDDKRTFIITINTFMPILMGIIFSVNIGIILLTSIILNILARTFFTIEDKNAFKKTRKLKKNIKNEKDLIELCEELLNRFEYLNEANKGIHLCLQAKYQSKLPYEEKYVFSTRLPQSNYQKKNKVKKRIKRKEEI